MPGHLNQASDLRVPSCFHFRGGDPSAAGCDVPKTRGAWLATVRTPPLVSIKRSASPIDKRTSLEQERRVMQGYSTRGLRGCRWSICVLTPPLFVLGPPARGSQCA